MPKDLIRCDLTYVMPEFTEKCLDMLAACRARGFDYYWISSFRSWGEQHQLRQNFLLGKGGRAAPAGDSAHNYGLAADFAHDLDPKKKGLQPNWIPANYAVLGEEAERLGLIWGKSFGDLPHVQWPGYVNAKQLLPLKTIWTQTSDGKPGWQMRNLQAVWKVVHAASPNLASQTPTNFIPKP